ncbi:MAG TPA: hypothetical protein VGA13_03940 [Acidimicrobiales bacterium]
MDDPDEPFELVEVSDVFVLVDVDPDESDELDDDEESDDALAESDLADVFDFDLPDERVSVL